MNLTHQLVRNSAARAWQLIASLLVAMVLPPVIIRAIGLKAFGVWVLIQAVSQLTNLFNLALQSAIAKYVAEYRTTGAYGRLASVISAAFLICGTTSTFFLLSYVTFSDRILRLIFKGGAAGAEDLNSLLFSMLAITGAGFVAQVFTAIMNGFQRMDWSNNIAAAGFVINGLSTLVFLALGLQLWALAAATLVSTLFLTVTCFHYASRLLSSLPQKPAKWMRLDLHTIKKLLTLSSSDVTIAAVTTGWSSGIRLLLGTYAGPSDVAYYDLAQRIRTQLQIFPSIVNGPLGPAASELEASKGKGAGRHVATEALRLIHIVTFPMFIFCVFLARPLVRAWLGNEYDIVALCIQILALPTYITVVNGPAYNTLIGLGNPVPGLKFSTISLLVNITLTVALAMKFGVLGAVVGESIALGLAAMYFFVKANQAMEVPFGSLKRILAGPALAVVALSPMLLLISWGASITEISKRVPVWFTVYGVFATCVYSLLRRFRIISKKDLLFLRDAAMVIVGRRRD